MGDMALQLVQGPIQGPIRSQELPTGSLPNHSESGLKLILMHFNSILIRK